MPMGPTNSLTVFAALMRRVLVPALADAVLIWVQQGHEARQSRALRSTWMTFLSTGISPPLRRMYGTYTLCSSC
jgi:hypothetical protein